MQIGWTAGIIDGEGSIEVSITRVKHRPTGYRIGVRVGNTNVKMLEALQSMWGGGITISRQNSKLGYRDFYVWTLLSLNAQALLVAVEPHLIVKRQQANIALALQRRIKGRFGHEILIDRTGFRPKLQGAKVTQMEWKARHRLYLKMKALNQRRVVRPDAKCKPPALCPGNVIAA